MLRKMDVSDQSMPLEEIRDYLVARYEDRFVVDPWRFEDVVASVYRDHGYFARVTARNGDGGIDVVLDGPGDVQIGVQVKRYRYKISVEQIRSFVGALVVNGLTKGMFVTTSRFQSGCDRTATVAALAGYPVELVDAQRFYEALKIAQHQKHCWVDEDFIRFCHSQLVFMDERLKGRTDWTSAEILLMRAHSKP
jgi:restriction system protein